MKFRFYLASGQTIDCFCYVLSKRKYLDAKFDLSNVTSLDETECYQLYNSKEESEARIGSIYQKSDVLNVKSIIN